MGLDADDGLCGPDTYGQWLYLLCSRGAKVPEKAWPSFLPELSKLLKKRWPTLRVFQPNPQDFCQAWVASIYLFPIRFFLLFNRDEKARRHYAIRQRCWQDKNLVDPWRILFRSVVDAKIEASSVSFQCSSPRVDKMLKMLKSHSSHAWHALTKRLSSAPSCNKKYGRELTHRVHLRTILPTILLQHCLKWLWTMKNDNEQ